MPAKPKKSKSIFHPDSVWKLVRQLAEAGHKLSALAVTHRINPQSVYSRAAREGWNIPKSSPPKSKGKKLGVPAVVPQVVENKGVSGDISTKSVKKEPRRLPLGPFPDVPKDCVICEPPMHNDITPHIPNALQQQDPTQNAVAEAVGALIIAGLPALEIPRSLKDLALALDIYRRASGATDKAAAAGSAKVLVRVTGVNQIQNPKRTQSKTQSEPEPEPIEAEIVTNGEELDIENYEV